MIERLLHHPKVLTDLWSLDPNRFTARAACHRRHFHQPGQIISALSAAGLAMRSAECWTYQMDQLDERQVQLIRKYNAQQRLRLRQDNDAGWRADLYWVRIIAEKL